MGTITELFDYLRVLYARAGEQRCHQCGGAVSARSAAEIVDELCTLPSGTKATLLAPKVRLFYNTCFRWLQQCRF